MAGEQHLDAPEAPRDFAAAVGKVVVTARMLFIYPVLLSWTERTPTSGEIVLVVVLAALSLAALLRWRWMARFIRSHPIEIGRASCRERV